MGSYFSRSEDRVQNLNDSTSQNVFPPVSGDYCLNCFVYKFFRQWLRLILIKKFKLDSLVQDKILLLELMKTYF